MKGNKDARRRRAARSSCTRSCAEKAPRGRGGGGRAGEACEDAGSGEGLPHRPPPQAPERDTHTPFRPATGLPKLSPTPSPNSGGADSPRGPGGRLRPCVQAGPGGKGEGRGRGGGKRRPGRVLSARGGGQEGGPGAAGLQPEQLRRRHRRRARPRAVPQPACAGAEVAAPRERAGRGRWGGGCRGAEGGTAEKFLGGEFQLRFPSVPGRARRLGRVRKRAGSSPARPSPGPFSRPRAPSRCARLLWEIPVLVYK